MTDTDTTPPRWLTVAVPGIAMCLGWGLRGQFGGPRGAMVPGALVALALALVARRRLSAAQVGTVAAAGALGFAIGGEETYGQTVGLARNTDLSLPYWNRLVAWGYLGLLLKGAVWGGLGGLIIGSALGGRRYTTGQLLVAFNVALAVSFLGFWFINEPKLLYFSGHSGGRPRQEGWAGLWLAWLCLLWLAARAQDRPAVRLSLFGALGCGLGFSLGRLAFAMGERFGPVSLSPYVDWWKVMECGFGLIGGLVMGWGWRGGEGAKGRGDDRVTGWQGDRVTEQASDPTPNTKHRTRGIQNSELETRYSALPHDPTPNAQRLTPLLFALLSLDLLVFFYIADAMDTPAHWIGKVPFLFIVPAFLLLANRRPSLQLALGVVMPLALTFWNVQHYWVEEKHLVGGALSLAGVGLLTVLAAEAARRLADRPARLFMLLVWGGTVCAWIKMFLPAPEAWGQPVVVQGLFTLMALWLTWEMRDRLRAESATGPEEDCL